MVNGWTRRVSKRLVSRRRKKGQAPTILSTAHFFVNGFWGR